jgi:hypothetical protein
VPESRRNKEHLPGAKIGRTNTSREEVEEEETAEAEEKEKH